MTVAGEYAYAGRDMVVNKVLEILGNPKITYEVHNHHNFAWFEEHFGEKYCVVRKGCTPAFPGQSGFIGANMLDKSVIVEGVDSQAAKDGLYSTVHGAGRLLSRTAASGKKKWIKGKQILLDPSDPKYVEPIVNFSEVKETMKSHNVELRGAGGDEAPECYKSLKEVLAYQGYGTTQGFENRTIQIKHILNPIGVAMAGDETYDPIQRLNECSKYQNRNNYLEYLFLFTGRNS